MRKYEICRADYDSFLTAPSIADQYAMMALTLPDVHTVRVVKRKITDPQGGIGIRLGNTPVYIGGSYGRKVEETVEYTFYKY